MGVLLVCDAPLESCFRSIPAIEVDGKVAAPLGWKIVVTNDRRLQVWCSENCMRKALAREPKRPRRK